MRRLALRSFFFFNDTATTEIYTLSLHDALPICPARGRARGGPGARRAAPRRAGDCARSEEHTSELQSPCNLVCRLLLEKKKTKSTCPAAGTAAPSSPHHRRPRRPGGGGCCPHAR